MATRGSIPEIMKRAGIEMLDPDVGIPLVRQELAKGRTGEIVVGGKLGILVEPKDTDGGANPKTAVASARKAPLAWTFKALRSDPYEGIVLSATLDPKHPYLNDHRIDGVAVMPGVMGLELFAEAVAAIDASATVVEIDNATFAAPLKCYRDQPREALVTVQLLLDNNERVARCTLHSVQAIKGSDQPAEPKLHFSATLRLGTTLPKGESQGAAVIQAQGPTVSRADLYKAYFHGPAFQVLATTAQSEDSSRLYGMLQRPMPPMMKANDKADQTQPAWLTAPRLLELCFQTAGIIEIGSTRKLGLPSRIDRVRLFEGADEARAVHARVEAKGLASEALSFEAVVTDQEGRMLMQVSGYHTSALPAPLDELTWKPLNAAVKGLK